ncbi:hypothetical protein Hanom_Chr09g00803951 [Helianthus anomalus]
MAAAAACTAKSFQWFAFANCVPDEIVEDHYYNALAFHSLGSTSSPVNNQR